MYLWQTRISQPKKAIRKDKKGNKKKKKNKNSPGRCVLFEKGEFYLSFFVTHTHTHTYTLAGTFCRTL